MPASVIAAGIGAVGSIAGGLLSGNSASQAAQAQVQATKLQIAELQREYDQNRQDFAPWRTTGAGALDQLAQIYGLPTYQNGQVVPGHPGQGPDYSSFYKSPDYNFQMQQGIAGVDAGAAARGSLDSGATRKAEISFASNLADSSFNQYANRLAGIAGLGQTATSNNAQLGTQLAGEIGNAYQTAGNAQASSYLAQGNAYSNALSGLAGIGSGLIMNNPQWFGGGSSAYNAQAQSGGWF